MSWSRILHRLTHFYPRPWRERYGPETGSLIEDLLAQEHPHHMRLAGDLFLGAVKEHFRPSVADPAPAPVAPPGFVNLWRHQTIMGRTHLTEAELALFASDEWVVGTFDAVSGHPVLLRLASAFISSTFWELGAFLAFLFPSLTSPSGLARHYVFPFLVWELGFAVLSASTLVACRVTGTRTVMFAMTTHGLVECRLDRRRRPVAIRGRAPAVRPTIVKRGSGHLKVALGADTVWVRKSLDPLLGWMATARESQGA